MNSRSLSTIAVIVLLLLGGLLMGLRWYRIQRLERAREEQLWELVYTASFDADLASPTEEAILRFGLPLNTRHCKVLNLDEEPWTVSSPSIEKSRVPLKMSGTNLLRLTTRQAGQRYSMSANFKLLISPRAESRGESSIENLTIDQRQVFLKPEKPASAAAYTEALRSALEQLPDSAETYAQQVQWAFEFCSKIDSSGDSASDDVDVALKNGKGTPKARARAMVALCREMKIPARLVAGFRVQQGANVQPIVWVEVYLQQAWVPFDPTAGWSLTLPMDYVPVWRDSDQVSTSKNVINFTPVFSIRRLKPNPAVLRTEIKHPIQIFNLTRLPFPMHRVMKILLLLPFAALITAIIRNMVGVQTFGTFSPALLAMSFIYADWKTGLMILIVVVTIGLFGRNFLERLRLLMVPRLSIVLTMVLMCVVFSVSALHYMLPTITAEAVLLPMVIMTMLIERFHVTVEEDGMMFAIKLSIGTLVVAVLCFLVLRWEDVGQWVLTYPEIHFFTIAAFILLGRYAGYRLTELWRFRDLVEANEAVR